MATFLAPALLLASCSRGSDEVAPAVAAIEPSNQSSAYGSGNLTADGLILMPPPVERTEATARLDEFAARMIVDGRCTTIRRHYSAVVVTGLGIACLQTSDLLTDSQILAVDPNVLLSSQDQVDAFVSLEDRRSGSVKIYGDYVVLLIENPDGTFSIAVDTVSSATDNQSINDILLAKGNFTS